MYVPPEGRVCLDARRHGVALLRPLAGALAVAAVGGVLLTLPSPALLFGPLLIAIGAGVALAAVWRWDRTRLLVMTDRVVLEHGVVQRHREGVRFSRVRSVEVRQTLPGRLLGYGTLTAGKLRVEYVPREVVELLG